MRKLKNFEILEWQNLSWLKETIELRECTHKKKANAEKVVKTDWKAVAINHFVVDRKKNVQGKCLQHGGWTFKWKHELR